MGAAMLVAQVVLALVFGVTGVAKVQVFDDPTLRYLLTGTAEGGPYSDEAALVLGPTGDPLPSPSVVSYYLDHYLTSPAPTPSGVTPEIAGFTGNPDNVLGFDTPEQFTSASYLQGDADVVHELLTRYNDILANGPDSPLYLFGYSQSSTILTAVDSHLDNPQWLDYVLTNGGYASDVTTYANELSNLSDIAPDLRLVLVGDPAAAPIPANVDNGFASSGFDNAGFTQFWLDSGLMGYGGGTIDGKADANVATGYIGGTGVNAPVETDGYAMAGQNTNLDLSPTAVYTVTGDNWAQATNFFGLPNTAGLAHIVYPGADASDFTFVDHIGNVDYFDSDSTFNLWGALWTAMFTALGGM